MIGGRGAGGLVGPSSREYGSDPRYLFCMAAIREPTASLSVDRMAASAARSVDDEGVEDDVCSSDTTPLPLVPPPAPCLPLAESPDPLPLPSAGSLCSLPAIAVSMLVSSNEKVVVVTFFFKNMEES